MQSEQNLLTYLLEREKTCRERAAAAEDFEVKRHWEEVAEEWRALILEVERQREGSEEIAPLSPSFPGRVLH